MRPHRSEIYRQLWELEKGYARVRRSLRNLQSTPGFQPAELARYIALAAEARATTLSHLLETVGDWEVQEAGRLFASRRGRERREE